MLIMLLVFKLYIYNVVHHTIQDTSFVNRTSHMMGGGAIIQEACPHYRCQHTVLGDKKTVDCTHTLYIVQSNLALS